MNKLFIEVKCQLFFLIVDAKFAKFHIQMLLNNQKYTFMIKPQVNQAQIIQQKDGCVKEQLKNEKAMPKTKQKLTYIECFDTEIPYINFTDSSSISSLVFTTQTKIKKQKTKRNQTQLPQGILNKLLRKPKYIHLIRQNIIKGGFGHGSVIFKRPVIEGTYYLQIKVLSDGPKFIKQVKNPSSVRVGIAPYDYKSIYPLGLHESVAYKSSNGCIIKDGFAIHQDKTFEARDTIGVVMTVAPPYKNPIAAKVSEGSSVAFYKNGKFIYQYTQMKQIFYCFSISLYNYSRVQVLQARQQQQYIKHKHALHYYKIFEEQIIYQDLKENQLFKSKFD